MTTEPLSSPASGASLKPAEPRLARSWRHRCPAPLRYLIAVALVALASAITFALRHLIDAPSFQTPFFVCAIVLCSWIGGAGPGITATVLSILTIEYYFTEPKYTLSFSLSEIPKFTVFLLAGTFISMLARRQRRDEEALLVARESLEEKVRERTADLESTNVKLTAEIGERTRAENELHRLNRAWRVRGLLNRSVARSADEHELLARVCQALIKAGSHQLAWIAEIRQGKIACAAHAAVAGFHHTEVAWAPEGHGHDLASRAIEGGTPVSCTLRERSPELPRLAWAEENHVKAVVALPLIAEGTVIGSLLVYSEEWDAFDRKETDLLQQAANDVAQGMILFQTRAARTAAESALKETRSDLERVARATTMGELAASIAHEINQPLAAVVTNGNACLRWLDREPPELDEARETARRIIRDGKRGSEVLARIRSLLKKSDPVREPVAVCEVIQEILALARSSLDGVALETQLEPELPRVQGDRVQLQQVLLNLVVNASDAMKSVSDRPKTLRIEAERNAAGNLEVAVRDSGTGLPPDLLERVFSTFFTTKSEGLGMGLAICRSIMEQHGGRLWAESNPDFGATFRFTLPVENS
jgi:signal transduction histidine kinase